MNPLKLAIFGEVRKTYDEAYPLTDEQLNILLFHSPDSLRLTLKGFLVIKAIFTAYSFEFPATITTKHQYGLSKMEYPYFFTKKRLVLFSEMDAMVVKLAGGVEHFLLTSAQLDN